MEDVSEAKSALEEDRALRGAEVGSRSPGARRVWAVVVLPEARADGRGVFYRRGGRLFLLPWDAVGGAHAAEVGEPEGVQSLVVDLLLAGRSQARCRLAADPGEEARTLCLAILRGIGRERCTASLRAAASEGYATRSYGDLESFEADSPEDWPPPARY